MIQKKIKPKLSIGIPVYNGEKFIKKCLDSLLLQTFSDFEIIISDNASTDLTSKICEEYKKQDKRILFFKQKYNTRMVANFNFVLQQAKGEYFMWASADDVWHSEFVERNIMFLEKNPGFVGSTSEIEYFYEPWGEKNFERFKDTKSKKKYEEGEIIVQTPVAHSLVGSFEEKVKFLFDFGKFEYLYSIYRTEYLKKCIIKKEFMSWEVPLILKILKYGNLNVEDGVMMYKYMIDKKDPNFYKKLFSTAKNYRGYVTLASLFPFVPLTLYVLAAVGPKIFFKHLLKGFIKDNYRAQRLVFLEVFSREEK